MFSRLLFATAICTGAFAGTIDSGTISTYGFGSPIQWHVAMTSDDEGYTVAFQPYGNGGDSCPNCPVIDPGDDVTVSETESDALFGSQGTGNIGGTLYSSLIFDSAGYGIDSFMTLTMSFVAGGPGLYVEPFTMTGYLQAATQANPTQLLLNEAVTGYGYATFVLSGSPETLSSTITWTFTPEPGTIGPALCGLGLLLGAGRYFRRGRLGSRAGSAG